MDERKPSDAADRIVVRTPEGMRDKLNVLAKKNGRSTNAEVLKALESWLAHDPEAQVSLMRLPERLRERVVTAARFSGRSVFDEIVARLADSFAPVAPRHVEGEQLDLRAEIRDAMHEAIEGLLAEPERLKWFEARARSADNDPSGS